MPLLRKQQHRNGSGYENARGSFPSSPASPSTPSPLLSSSSSFSPTHASPSSPSSPSTPRTSFPATPATSNTERAQNQPQTDTFQATPPSAYTPSEYAHVRHRSGGEAYYNEMFDPFSNAPRPRRKPYSPFSAFEAKTSMQEGGGGEGGEERPMSMASTASGYSFEAVSVDNNNGQAQGHPGSKHRKSGLSFEIGGDETDTDRSVMQPAQVITPTQSQQHNQHHSLIQKKGEFLAPGRPSTGDSSHDHNTEPEAEPESHHPSSREEDSSASASASNNDPEPDSADADIAEIEDDPTDLVPPHPRFLRDGPNTSRASWSSQDSSLYPSGPNSDTELVGGGATSDSDRDREVVRNNTGRNAAYGQASRGGRVARERANTGPTAGAPYSQRQNAYKRRSGSYSAMPNVAGGHSLPPGAAPPAHIQQQQVQVPAQPTPVQGRQGALPYQNTRRYSGGAHRRSSSSANAAVPAPASTVPGVVSGEIEEIDRSTGENITRSESPSVSGGTGVGPRARAAAGVAPPSAFRGSRTSFSGPPPGTVVPGSVGVPDDAHPLSPIPSDTEDPSQQQQQNANGEGQRPTSSVGHGSFVSASPDVGAAAGVYAHQYPHAPNYGPVGYQYPPSPPPGAQQAYPGGAPYPGYPAPPAQGTYPLGLMTAQGQYPAYANGAPMSPVSPNGVPISPNGAVPGGYTTLTQRGPPPHNAFIANSAIARSSSAVDLVPYAARFNGVAGGVPGSVHSRRNSVDVGGFAPPQPPFAQGAAGYPPPSPGTPGTPELRHAGSLPRLREPFLSPASRRSSSVWAPPTPAVHTTTNIGYADAGDGRNSGFFGGYAYNGVGSGSNTMLALPGKKEPLPSSALRRKLSMSEKPWIKNREKGERAAWWLTFCIMWLGVAVGVVVIFFDFIGVRKIDGNLCSVLDEDFSSFNTDTWAKNISLGGYGNGEFQMTTDSSDNLYIKNGQLYIMPTLTSDEIGESSIFDGYTYNLTGCTESWNASACNVRSDQGTNTVINPVKSARISTKDSVSIAYGKVEIVAKMPRGDWLWPAIWMLPKDEKYGEWPRSGEIDIVEARGNDASYSGQGYNVVRSSLNWGPLDSVLASSYGWQSVKRSSYAAGFHTYTLEWTSDFMRMSVDSRLRAMLDLNIAKKSFFDRGDFPLTTQNGSTEAVVENIWEGQPNAAPFDQEFYLIISLSVGGTSGWFPDKVGDKMWFDGSATAMTDFAKEQDEWFSTWPSSDDDRALRVDSVKMWKLC
ncbi:hypothetical protein A7U60_g659 [Sanghuangporus baumii]|uniref:GH16 domain-containing protein n=1 Tax=Sanghuangporus baumii TaxID=108892 RepID=A0A9Q5NBS5_SANBA|nr:hypothetical protein A7U60_g659 [Sanghuangporus baumii]